MAIIFVEQYFKLYNILLYRTPFVYPILLVYIPKECQCNPLGTIPDHEASILSKLVIARPGRELGELTTLIGLKDIAPSLSKLTFNARRFSLVVSTRGIPMFHRSLRGTVPLDEVLVVFGKTLVLRFRPTTFNAIIKVFKVQFRGI